MDDLQEYKTGTTTVKAVQWFANGDHPLDNARPIVIDGDEFLSEGEIVRRFRSPDIKGTDVCDKCGNIFHVHGWIDDTDGGQTVCPRDYVITNEAGDTYPTPEKDFESTYNLKAGYGG